MAGKSFGDLMVEILKGIRQEIRATNDELQALKTEVRATNARLDETNERLDTLARRETESEVRLATELIGVAAAVDGVRDLLSANLVVRDQVADHERRIALLEQRRGT